MPIYGLALLALVVAWLVVYGATRDRASRLRVSALLASPVRLVRRRRRACAATMGVVALAGVLMLIRADGHITWWEASLAAALGGVLGFAAVLADRVGTGLLTRRAASARTRGLVALAILLAPLAVIAGLGGGVAVDAAPQHDAANPLEQIARDPTVLTIARYAAIMLLIYIILSIVVLVARGQYLSRGAGFEAEAAQRLTDATRQTQEASVAAIEASTVLDSQLQVTTEMLHDALAAREAAERELARLRRRVAALQEEIR